jgi:hypothetical protein
VGDAAEEAERVSLGCAALRGPPEAQAEEVGAPTPAAGRRTTGMHRRRSWCLVPTVESRIRAAILFANNLKDLLA